MWDTPITVQELHETMRKIKHKGKSVDQDGIHSLMLKNAGNQFTMLLLHLFNIVLSTGNWPWIVG